MKMLPLMSFLDITLDFAMKDKKKSISGRSTIRSGFVLGKVCYGLLI